MSVELDHIVLGAHSLEQGVAYIEEKFGVQVPKGGEHLQMGTHNHVMALGSSCYFEIISIAPHLTRPDRPLWFGLDNADQLTRLAERPRILTWVVRTPRVAEALSGADYDFGDVVAMQRGDLSWQLTIRPDGHLPFNGLWPSLIEWQDNLPPIDRMPDLGCRLTSLNIASDKAKLIRQVLDSIDASALVQVIQTAQEQKNITAEFSTPLGLVMLD